MSALSAMAAGIRQSGVFVDGGLDDSDGFPLAFNEGLDALDCLRGEKLLARLSADTGRHALDDVELSTMLQCVSDLRVHRRFFQCDLRES